ncbi:MAG: DUF5937 family protein [Streptosporangiaceae bacterium]
MLELPFTAEELAQTRFALSPLWEVVASVRVLKHPDEHALHRPWVGWARRRLAGLDWRLLADLVPPHMIPAFVCPPPSTPLPDLGLELATLRATPTDRVREDLRDLHGERIAALDEDPAGGLQRLAEVIEAYWEAALAPYWPRIRTLLEGDILYRARRLTEGGASRLFSDLDPSVTWDTDTLYVAHRHASGARELAGRGLLLVPSVFAWPRVFSITSSRWQPTLRYPPRGVGALWEHRETPAPEALAAVLGRSRARLLAELDAPASTQDLARRTGLSAGGVSQHLTALRAAGLVNAHRTGRVVLYARTGAAESLLTGATE